MTRILMLLMMFSFVNCKASIVSGEADHLLERTAQTISTGYAVKDWQFQEVLNEIESNNLISETADSVSSHTVIKEFEEFMNFIFEDKIKNQQQIEAADQFVTMLYSSENKTKNSVLNNAILMIAERFSN